MSKISKNKKKDQEPPPENFEMLAALALDVAKYPPSDWNFSERKLMTDLIRLTGFFQKNLDSKVSLNDFLKLVQDHIGYEKHPYGSIIIEEGQFAEKFYVILKGQVRKFAPRPIEEIEEEFYKTHKKEEEPQNDKKPTLVKQLSQNSLTPTNKALQAKKNKVLNASLLIGVMRSHSKRDLNSPKENSPKTKAGVGRKGFKAEIEAKLARMPTSRTIILKDNKVNSSQRIEQTEVEEEEELEIGSEDPEIKARRELREFAKKIKEDESLLLSVAAKNEDKRNKLFLADIPRIQRVKDITAGQYFGESFNRNLRPKDDTIIAVEDVQVLTITREDYQKILKELIIRVRDKVEFFLQVFPNFRKEYIARFSYYFSECQYQKGDIIMEEGGPSNTLFLLKSGEVKLVKTIEIDNTNPKESSKLENLFLRTQKQNIKVTLPIAKVVEKQFFGEEVIVKKEGRLFQAIAGPTGALCYTIDSNIYNSIKSLFEDIAQDLRNQAKEKINWRLDRLQNLLEQKEITNQKNIFAEKYKALLKVPRKIPEEIEIPQTDRPLYTNGTQDSTTVETEPVALLKSGGRLNKNRLAVQLYSPKHSEEVRKNLQLIRTSITDTLMNRSCKLRKIM